MIDSRKNTMKARAMRLPGLWSSHGRSSGRHRGNPWTGCRRPGFNRPQRRTRHATPQLHSAARVQVRSPYSSPPASHRSSVPLRGVRRRGETCLLRAGPAGWRQQQLGSRSQTCSQAWILDGGTIYVGSTRSVDCLPMSTKENTKTPAFPIPSDFP